VIQHLNAAVMVIVCHRMMSGRTTEKMNLECGKNRSNLTLTQNLMVPPRIIALSADFYSYFIELIYIMQLSS